MNIELRNVKSIDNVFFCTYFIDYVSVVFSSRANCLLRRGNCNFLFNFSYVITHMICMCSHVM